MRMWNERFRVPKRLRERVEDALLAVRAAPGALQIVRRWPDVVPGDAVDLLDLLTRLGRRALAKEWRSMTRPEEGSDTLQLDSERYFASMPASLRTRTCFTAQRLVAARMFQLKINRVGGAA